MQTLQPDSRKHFEGVLLATLLRCTSSAAAEVRTAPGRRLPTVNQEQCADSQLPPLPPFLLQGWSSAVAERAFEVASTGKNDSGFVSTVIDALLQPTLQWPQWAEPGGKRAAVCLASSSGLDAARAMSGLVAALCTQFGVKTVLANR